MRKIEECWIESPQDFLVFDPRTVRIVHDWHEGMTLKTIGLQEGVSTERIRQLLARARRRLYAHRRYLDSLKETVTLTERTVEMKETP